MQPLKVNLGCQIHHFDGWINQDIVADDKDYHLEWICDANQLPTGDNTVDFMYAGHLVEHFYPDTIEQYVREWYRVMKPGGRLFVVTPDFGRCAKLYAQGTLKMEDLFQQAFGRIYHYDRPEERHHILYDDAVLLQYMCIAPWSSATKVDMQNPSDIPLEVREFMGTHISAGDLQLAYLFTK